METPKFKSSLPDFVIAVALAAAFALLATFGIYTLYPMPASPFEPSTEAECIAVGGQWVPDPTDDYYSYCDWIGSDYEDYYAALDTAYFGMSVLGTLIGLLAVCLGLFCIKKKAVASGLLFGGLIVLFWTALATWFVGPVPVIGLAVAFIAVIVAAYNKK